MISKKTAVQIFTCYQEIENAEKIIEDLLESRKKSPDEVPSLSNAFGEKCGLQLGVPSGSNSHRLFHVNFEMSLKIIEQHIKDKNKRLRELEAIARLELKDK